MNYVVIDLEMCRVKGKLYRKQYGRGTETIQIGAVLMDDDYEIKDQFMSYISPAYGHMDSFIKELTGISAGDLASAPSFADALSAFVSWIPEGDVTFVSWSMTDKSQLIHDMSIRGISDERLEQSMENWDDCQKAFDERLYYNRPTSLESALMIADIDTGRRSHDGLDDAWNTAVLFRKLRLEPEMKLNSYYAKAHNCVDERLTFSLGDLIAAMGYSA